LTCPSVRASVTPKAERLTTQLLATLTFFFATIQAKVEALGLAPELETLVHQQLIPAIYLERVAARSTRAERRHELHRRSRALSAPLRLPDSPYVPNGANQETTL
jgi:hypothetical protein